jgi:hypothetical protein
MMAMTISPFAFSFTATRAWGTARVLANKLE